MSEICFPYSAVGDLSDFNAPDLLSQAAPSWTYALNKVFEDSRWANPNNFLTRIDIADKLETGISADLGLPQGDVVDMVFALQDSIKSRGLGNLIPASTNQFGAPNFEGKLYYIDLDKYIKSGGKVITTEEIKQAIKIAVQEGRIGPSMADRWIKNQSAMGPINSPSYGEAVKTLLQKASGNTPTVFRDSPFLKNMPPTWKNVVRIAAVRASSGLKEGEVGLTRPVPVGAMVSAKRLLAFKALRVGGRVMFAYAVFETAADTRRVGKCQDGKFGTLSAFRRTPVHYMDRCNCWR